MANAVRLVAIFTVLMSMGGGLTFLGVVRQNLDKDRRRPGFDWIHLVFLALGFWMLAVQALIELLSRWDGAVTWRIPLIFTAFTLINVAQGVLLRDQRQLKKQMGKWDER